MTSSYTSGYYILRNGQGDLWVIRWVRLIQIMLKKVELCMSTNVVLDIQAENGK